MYSQEAVEAPEEALDQSWNNVIHARVRCSFVCFFLNRLFLLLLFFLTCCMKIKLQLLQFYIIKKTMVRIVRQTTTLQVAVHVTQISAYGTHKNLAVRKNHGSDVYSVRKKKRHSVSTRHDANDHGT